MTSVFPGSSSTRDLFAGLHAVEELRCRQHAHIAVELPFLREGKKHLRIHQVAHQVRAACVVANLLFEHRRRLLHVRRERDARRGVRVSVSGPRRTASTIFGGQPPSGSPSAPENISTTELGSVKVWFAPKRSKLMNGHSVAHQEDRHVADDLARRRDLHDVAERHVDVGVGAGDLRPPVPEAHRFGLLLQVGVLAAGHLVEIDLGGAGLGAAVERSVIFAHDLPVVGAFVQRVEIETRVARGVGQARRRSS